MITVGNEFTTPPEEGVSLEGPLNFDVLGKVLLKV